MKILIEGYYYDPAILKREHIPDWLPEYHRDKNGRVCYNYVGHVYDPNINDYIFFLPKVILTQTDEKDEQKDQAFGKNPNDIISISEDSAQLETEDRRFVSEFAVWVYRALKVYRDDHPNQNIILERNIANVGRHSDTRLANTLLDVILELIAFNRENHDFVMFTLRNIHSGHNKINWTRTISKSQATIQNGSPIYLDLVNKKRQINFDEELFVIYYSILNYVHLHYGFDVDANVNFELISEDKFENLLDGMGCARLMRIKYKYFSDKALRLWNLCYAFFDMAHPVDVHENQKEYMLAQNFNIVFEAIIDKLVGSNDLPDELTEQKDGKRVDHMFTYDGLIYPDARQKNHAEKMYYIGDSKYYKTDAPVTGASVYKQFTYARNVIQWNIDLWYSDPDKKKRQNPDNIWLRDEVTEGYNIIPNFFISSTIDKSLDYDSDKLSEQDSKFDNFQFENRLFDRDTLLITHYNVNFLYVLSLYGRDDESAQESWKNAIRKKFKERVQKTLNDKYKFYAMTAKPNVDAEQYMREHFRELVGKVFTPFEDKEYFSLALNQEDGKFTEDNELLLAKLSQDFEYAECPMGEDPSAKLKKSQHEARAVTPQKYLTLHWLENYKEANILIGYCKSKEHLEWIMGKNDKGTNLYNVRLDKNRDGAFIRQRLIENKVSFVVLYNKELMDGGYRVFRVHHTAEMVEERMRRALYPNPEGKYFCYVFDEEVSLGNLDIDSLVAKRLKEGMIEYAPFMVKGEELLKYRQ